MSELLLHLARVWKQIQRGEDAQAALLAASRSNDSRTAEQAIELFGTRYPYPYEFLNALKLDPRNAISAANSLTFTSPCKTSPKPSSNWNSS